MWRHGEMFIAAIDAIPGEMVQRPGWVVVEGEATGHSHRLDRSGVADQLNRGETLYLRVLAERATVIDHRNRPITLPRGLYQIWKPVADSPGAARNDAYGDAERFKTERFTRRMRGACLPVLAASIGH